MAEEEELKPSEAIIMVLRKNEGKLIYRRDLIQKIVNHIDYNFNERQLQDALTYLIRKGKVEQRETDGLNTVYIPVKNAFGERVKKEKLREAVARVGKYKTKIPIFPNKEWNQQLEGGIPRGSLVGIAIPSDHGKTHLAVAMAVQAAALKNRVLFLSTAGEEGLEDVLELGTNFITNGRGDDQHEKMCYLINNDYLHIPPIKDTLHVDNIKQYVVQHAINVVIIDYLSPATINSKEVQGAVITQSSRELLEVINHSQTLPTVIVFLQLKAGEHNGKVGVEGEGQGQWINPYQHVFYWTKSEDLGPGRVRNYFCVRKGKRQFGAFKKDVSFSYDLDIKANRIRNFLVASFDKALEQDWRDMQ